MTGDIDASSLGGLFKLRGGDHCRGRTLLFSWELAKEIIYNIFKINELEIN